jgi:hypothetical protein
VQRIRYTGLARWAAATELHGEISALWATGKVAEHKAVLLDRDLLKRHSGIREKPGAMPRLPQQWRAGTADDRERAQVAAR